MNNRQTQFGILGLLVCCQCALAQNFWQPTGLDSMSVLDLAIDSSGNLLAGGNGLFRSTDNGNTWAIIGLSVEVRCLTVGPAGELMAGGWQGGIYRSSDNGLTWTDVLSVDYPLDFAISSNGLVFLAAGDERDGAHGGGIYRSTDRGETWDSPVTHPTSALGLNTNDEIFALSYDGYGTTMLRSSDMGLTWTPVQIIDTSAYGWPMAIARGPNGKMYCAALGVFRSTDDGITWEHILMDQAAFSLAIGTDGNIFIGTTGNGVFRSTDDGLSWDSINTGLSNRRIQSLGMSPSGHLFAGTENGLYRSVSTVTAVNMGPGPAPTSFTLSQNYPNPFNPTTVVRYQLPVASDVKLSVFDVLGREVEVLVDEKKEAGHHEVRFSGSGLASGVYIYRLSAGQYTETRKMVLMK